MALKKRTTSESTDTKPARKSAVSPEEAILIERAKHDAEAFGELYEMYVDRIYNYIYYRVHNVEDAEDLTTKVFQRAMNNMPKYKNTGAPFSAWLYRIARNLVLNWHRDTAKKQTVDIDAVAYSQVGAESPEIEIQWLEKESALMEAIGRLPDERQDILLYKYLHRMSNAQIGEILGKSEGAIKSLYHRTLLVLREDLTPTLVEDDTPKKVVSVPPKERSIRKRIRNLRNRSE